MDCIRDSRKRYGRFSSRGYVDEGEALWISDPTKRYVVPDLCRGQSVVDRLGILGRQPNAEVVLEASRERFVRMLFDAVSEP